ncbi:MAG: PAS domain S-box protein, partial [Rhodospirillales bacterium]|nr:PAS domain S-box protein [Rhodospirillales bacterium]
MTGVDKRRQQRLRRTKAQLVDELESLEREIAQAKLDDAGDGVGVSSSSAVLKESEALFKDIIDNSPAAILLKDLDGQYLMANTTWQEWFNPAGKDIAGKTVYDFYPKDHGDKIHAYDQETLKTGKPVLNEHKTTLLDGTVKDTILHKFPLRGADGKVIAICGVNTDISKQKRTQDALRQSEGRLLEALQSLRQAFALYDADDRLIAFNNEYARIRPGAKEIIEKGGTFEDIIRRNVELGLIPESYGREEAFIRERVKKHLDPRGTIIRKFKDGTWGRIEEVKTPSGGIATSFIDITDLKLAEQALKESEARFRNYAEVASDWFWEMDENLLFTYFSGRTYDVIGYKSDELVGKSRRDVNDERMTDPKWQRHFADLEARRPFNDFCYELRKPDGDGVHISISGAPAFDGHGVFKGYRGTGTDITKRQQAEAELLAAKE